MGKISLSWVSLGCTLTQQLLGSYVASKRGRGIWWIAAVIFGAALRLLVGFPTDPWRFFWTIVPHIPRMEFTQGLLFTILLVGTVLWSVAVTVPWLVLMGVACIMCMGEFRARRGKRESAQKHLVQPVGKLVSLVSPSGRVEDPKPYTTGIFKSERPATATVQHSLVPRQDTQSLSAWQLNSEGQQERGLYGQHRLGAVSGTALHPGLLRPNNQDCLFAVSLIVSTQNGLEGRGFYVVADGMGGQQGGKEASRRAVLAAVEMLFAGIAMWEGIGDEQARSLLWESVQHANRVLFQLNTGKHKEERMGTTLTLALLLGTRVFVANVGDSRTYLYTWRKGSIRQITLDHSHIARLVARGEITREDMYTHPDRNLIYRCVGDQLNVEVDTFQECVEPGDKLLLCSDGLWEMVRDPDIERMMSQSAHPETIASRLLEAALHCGGEDNFSAIVVHLASR